MRIGAVISSSDSQRVFQDIFKELEAYHDVDVYRFRLFKSPIFYYRINPVLQKYDFIKFMQKCDVLYFEWASDMLVFATNLPKVCPIITRLHRYELFQWADKVKWEAVDKVIFLTKAMQQKFISLHPEHANKTAVVPWAISTSKYKFSKNSFNGQICTLCEIVPRKRIYELILVYYQLIQQLNNSHLHIGGPINTNHLDYYDAIETLIKELTLHDKVTFHGKIIDVPQWFQKMDIFISNSNSEGLQSALTEAMSAGCYCLSHNWDGAEEILTEDNLFYTDGELLHKIKLYLMYSNDEKAQLSQNMEIIVREKFDLQKSLTQIREIIEEFDFK